MKKIKSRDLKSVYLFYGEEVYLIDYIIKCLKDTFIDQSFEALNYTVLEGEEVNLDKIVNACETLPFMSEKKIVIINDFQPLMSKKGEGSPMEEVNIKALSKYILELDDYLCLVFVIKQKDAKKSNQIYKSIKKAGDIVELKKLKGRDLDKWIENSFKKHGKKISKSNINYFIQESSYYDSNRSKTLYDLENEIIKVCNYLPGKSEVDKKTIDFLIPKPLEMNIFNLLNNISNKNGDNAIRLFNEMYISNEPALFILHMIVRQLRNMLSYKVLKMKGYSEGDIQNKIRLSNYEYKKVSAQSNNFTVNQLEKAMFHCLQTDKTIKSSLIDDRLAMEILITNLCFKI